MILNLGGRKSDASKLFDTPLPRVYTIPPTVNYLKAIATTLSDALDLKNDPAALASSILFTPNRRASRALAEEFHKYAIALGHAALISPDIRVLGDLEDDHTIAPLGVSELELGPPLSPAKRRGALAKLVQTFYKGAYGSELPPSSALFAADQLSSLLDQAAMGDNVDWSQLNTLIEESDLAAHWRLSAEFLEIIADAWPKYLEEQGATDPMARRVAAARATANRWMENLPDHPVIIAGSTGATPATRLLMAAAMRLPKGAVILPGLDPDVSDAAWQAIPASPSHPQHTLQRALTRLKIDKSHVMRWPDTDENINAQSRRKIINEALAPAVTTKDWTTRLKELAGKDSPQRLVEAGLSGLTLIEAEDENEEALAAALLMREALEIEGRTAALITPDAALSRRVSAIMKRWGVDISASSGTPFLQTHHGSLFALIFHWLKDEGDPIHLLSLLKHPLVRLGYSEEDYRAALQNLESHKNEFREKGTVRGPRRYQTLDDLADRLGMQDRQLAAQLIRDLVNVTRQSDIRPSEEDIDGNQFARSCARLAERLVAAADMSGPERLWRGAEGAEAARYLETLAEIAKELGPVSRDLWGDFAESIGSTMKVPPRGMEHPRLAIWGPLEARLQMRDVIILASLNEGSWPAATAIDSFMSRRIRKKMGLPDPEERIGLSAHDFSQLACAPNVVLLRSNRVDDKPAVASRWLWRLRTLASGGLEDGLKGADRLLAPSDTHNPLAWGESLRKAPPLEAINPPAPTPPLEARPKKFSVSRVATLIRDPYAVYAGDILKLKPLPPVGAQPGPAERGTAIHEAVDRHSKSGGDILCLVMEELEKAGETPTQIELNRPLWERAANAYLSWMDTRKDRVKDAKTEIEGELVFEISGLKYRLTGKADRIEILKNNTLAIIDFKTGTPKTKKQVETGLEPQLPLEAAIAKGGGYPKISSLDTSELIYVSLAPGAASVKADNGEPLKLDEGAMAEAAKARDGFITLAKAYANSTQPYYSKPRAEFSWSVSDYDRLARRDEWSGDTGGDA